MNKNKKNKPIYSAADKRAYYLGVGVGAGFRRYNGYKAVLAGLPKELRESFKNGVNSELSISTRRFKDK